LPEPDTNTYTDGYSYSHSAADTDTNPCLTDTYHSTNPNSDTDLRRP
jgi:hypothetical protein